MAREPLYLLFTQDCEQLAEHSKHGGPASWDQAERSTLGLADYLEAQGLRATFFVVAQTAARQRRMFLDLEERGHELGLHVHPQDTGRGFGDYLGGYAFDEQVRLLQETAGDWAQAIGHRPATFRGGNFSANDSTFPALAATGFRQGSCSSPGRRYVAAKAVWEGAEPWPLRAHGANRLYAGDVDFYEVPITCDQDHRRNPSLPLELRIEGGDAATHDRTIELALRRQAEAGVSPKTIVPFTHNHLEYGDPQDERRRTLEAVVGSAMRLAASMGFDLPACTLGTVRQAVLPGA